MSTTRKFLLPTSALRAAGFPLFALLSSAACSSPSSSSSTPAATDGGLAGTTETHAVTIDLVLRPDSSGGVALAEAQHVSSSDVVGKMVFASLFEEGKAPPTDTPIDTGSGPIRNLGASFNLSSKHPAGTYELAVVVSLSGWTPGPTSPGAQDLVTAPGPNAAGAPTDGVPSTGRTIRFQVSGDTALTVDNTELAPYSAATR